ncbi:tyrosine-type recombinase/integrase [Saccharopolyspora sp. NPDC049426]|uniref:tyrosine-type recombinase/integrase n=1 Tax=Saccharopolyspora sp. NPDC049426 TaxID=3155652 RepID=UPI00343090E9
MNLAVVRNIGSPNTLRSAQELQDFEQELVDQYALSMAAVGLTDRHIAAARAVVIEFARVLSGPVWTASVGDGDRYLVQLRQRGQSRATVRSKADGVARFYDFVLTRYQGDIHRLTGHVVEQPVDEYNRPSFPVSGTPRVPPSDDEVDTLFTHWRQSLVHARKYLPAARDYFTASLWRRLGLRISESTKLDIRDWRPDLGTSGKLHVRHGKGSRGRGHKPRLVPAINSADQLIDWWLAEVRPQFGPDWADPDAPMLPSERRDPDLGRCIRVGADALRSGLATATGQWLPGWSGKLTPHVLRHYCASSLYSAGMDLKAVQELLGHEWLSTTTRYVHVHSDSIERAWEQANHRTSHRLTTVEAR